MYCIQFNSIQFTWIHSVQLRTAVTLQTMINNKNHIIIMDGWISNMIGQCLRTTWIEMNETHFFTLKWQSMIAFSQFTDLADVMYDITSEDVKAIYLYSDRSSTHCTLNTVGLWNLSNSCEKATKKKEQNRKTVFHSQ